MDRAGAVRYQVGHGLQEGPARVDHVVHQQNPGALDLEGKGTLLLQLGLVVDRGEIVRVPLETQGAHLGFVPPERGQASAQLPRDRLAASKDADRVHFRPKLRVDSSGESVQCAMNTIVVGDQESPGVGHLRCGLKKVNSIRSSAYPEASDTILSTGLPR